MSFEDQSNPFAQEYQPSQPGRGNSGRGKSGRAKSGLVLWVLGGGAAIMLICCGGMFGGLVYIGVQGPETSVYVGNQVPNRFVQTAKDVGALQEGERVRFFYSDALTNIRDGFYLVSDTSVVIYIEDGRAEPLQVIPFGDIENADLYRETSFIEDSEIMIETKDGNFVAFPVSSEYDRDQQFYDAIMAGTQDQP